MVDHETLGEVHNTGGKSKISVEERTRVLIEESKGGQCDVDIKD